ncbi:CRISPR-associated endonuclease Cas3'' [Haloglomus salinum]|uniref:CRISPR-associated endonuclease Cas3'' n=1 Tax=Haloglomus salinum TaxID=2962673 RepID=UPI0020CA0C15|nr:CRISPR-associated endonuclease Cas3'' [Haloglomus salinum]
MPTPIISHPTNPFGENPLLLQDHLEAVADRAVTLGHERAAIPLRTIGLLHDFGKVTPQFQAYIRKEYNGPDTERYHARIGAFVTFYALQQQGLEPLDQLAGALAVAKHHGTIPDAAPYVGTRLTEAYQHEALHNQVERIDAEAADLADEIIRLATDGAGSWADFRTRFEDGTVVDGLESLSTTAPPLSPPKPDSEALPGRLYDRTLRYWGALTLADKSHASGLTTAALYDYGSLARGPLDDYIETLQGTADSDLEATLNTLREDARQQVVAGVQDWIEDPEAPSVATLRLPTGLGKTFTGISGALTAKAALPEMTPQRTLVYALPFTSIIEQTRAQFEDESIWGADPTGTAFTVHHHLSETVTYGDRAEERDDIEFLGESWRSGVVLTTFVQLFESLVGPTTSRGTKLPALEGSVVILDEPQALPKDWWAAMPRILEILTEEYGARVISMTATEPPLFRAFETADLLERGRTASEAAQQPRHETHSTRSYFRSAERVTYRCDESAYAHSPDRPTQYVAHAEAADRIHERAREEGTSVLSVCNTIESSRILTEELKQQPSTTHLGHALADVLEERAAPVTDLDPEAVARSVRARAGLGPTDSTPGTDETFLLTFNSRFRPFDRRVLIHLADHLSTANRPFVFVATQAVEAGVDLSFNTVYRDIAPLDSIVQAAGRCNRSFEWGERGGEVIIWTLAGPSEETPANPADPPPAEHVYEQSIPSHLRLVSATLSELDGDSEIPDSEVSDVAVRRYFDRLAEDKQVGDQGITEEIEACEGDRLLGRSLIGDYQTVDTVVGVSSGDETVISDAAAEFQPVPTRAAYEAAEGLSSLRVSVPETVMESATKVPRLDRNSRGDTEGIQLFEYTNQPGLAYNLAGAGLVEDQEGIGGRFTVL